MYISTCRVELYEVYGRKIPITKNTRNSTVARRTPVQSNYSSAVGSQIMCTLFCSIRNRQKSNVVLVLIR